MCDFLAHHMFAFVGVVVGGGIEVGVVHFCRTLRDVISAGQIDRGQTQPTIIAIGTIANLRGSRDHRTTLIRRACDHRSEERRVPGIPVTGCL